MKKKLLLLAALFTLPYISFSQEDLEHKAPTLQVGLDGLSFGKGSLDAQLIMEIIAQKQQEIKVKAVQNMFLSKIDECGGTIYNFGDGVVREILEESDPKIRTRKIIENSINLSFTISYLEYYLRNIPPEDSSEFISLAKVFRYTITSTKNLSIKYFIQKKRQAQDRFYRDEKAFEFITFLIDLTNEVIRHDKNLSDLGIMRISYSSTYDYLNKYLTVKNADCSQSQKNAIPYIVRQFMADNDINELEKKCNQASNAGTAVYEKMKSHLEKFTRYIGLISYFQKELTFRNNQIQKLSFDSISDDKQELLNSICIEISELILKLQTVIKETNTDFAMIGKNEIASLAKIELYLQKAKRFFEKITTGQSDIPAIADIIYTFYSEFIPLIENSTYLNLNLVELSGKISEVTNKIAKFISHSDKFLANLSSKTDKFIQFVSKLYEFDKAETISDYLSFIDGTAELIPDDRAKFALSSITSFVKDYSVIVTDKNGKEALSFNAETFLIKLQNLKPDKFKHFQFHFTVGVNNTYFDKGIVLPDSSVRIKNFSNVSEKIGIRYKIYDWSYSRGKNPGESFRYNGRSYVRNVAPREPLISNAHVLIYGSGILYNVFNTGTNKEFNFPMAGIGAGITFFNAMDLNFSVGVPILPNTDLWELRKNNFFNLGFDIQFVEYLKKLNEKRDARKTQKALAEYGKEE